MSTQEQVVDATMEVEQSVLGAMMLNAEAFDTIGGLKAEHFWHYRHRKIFDAITTLVAAGRGSDVMTVYERLAAAGQIDDGDSMLPYLNSLVQSTPSSAGAARYAAMVIDRFKMRQLAVAGRDLQERAANPRGVTREEIVAHAQAQLDAVSNDESGSGPTTMGPILTKVVERIDQAYHGSTPVALSTGLRDLDKQLAGGLRPGQVIVVAGRPGMGKTALALGLAEAAEEQHQDKVPFFWSGEMPGEDLGNRALARASGLPLEKIITGKLDDADWPLLTHGVQKLSESRLLIDDTPALGLAQIGARARKIKRQHGLSLMILDYLQLMAMAGGENRTQQIGEVTRGLKVLAKQLGIPIVLLSQLSRKVEERSDKRPMNSDLRESGDIEQDADVIIMLYRDEIYSPDSPDRGTMELGVTKQRSGPLGTVLTTYLAERTLVVDRAMPGEY
jgi:replicative DNA helicase